MSLVLGYQRAILLHPALNIDPILFGVMISVLSTATLGTVESGRCKVVVVMGR